MTANYKSSDAIYWPVYSRIGALAFAMSTLKRSIEFRERKYVEAPRHNAPPSEDFFGPNLLALGQTNLDWKSQYTPGGRVASPR